MCLTYNVKFEECGHHDAELDRSYVCPDHCESFDFIDHKEDGFCSSCLQHPHLRPEPSSRIVLFWPGIELKREIDQLLDKIAAKPGERYVTFFQATNPTAATILTTKGGMEQVGKSHRWEPYFVFFRVTNTTTVEDSDATDDIELDDGINKYVYDSHNLHEFSGHLMERTFRAGQNLLFQDLLFLLYVLTGIIHDERFPERFRELEIGEFRLFCQIRAMAVRHDIAQIEKYKMQVGHNGTEALVRRLSTILTPVPVLGLDDDKDCPICREPLNPPGEDAVKLPCGHIFGRCCFETWLRAWVPGHPLNICPSCRANFDILSPCERANGITVDAVNIGLPAGMWLDLVMHSFGRSR